VRAVTRQRTAEIGRQPSERANGERIPEHAPEHAIAAVLVLAQSVAVLDPCVPAGHASGPRSEAIVDADIVPEHITTPAVMIPSDHHHFDPGVPQVGQCREHPEPTPRDHGLPFVPEIKEIAVDQQRLGPSGQTSQKAEHRAFHIGRGDAQVRV